MLHTETQSVTVTNGVFDVVLGTTATLNAPFDIPYFLGVTVAPDVAEMTPRQPVAASAYAIRSATTEALAANGTNCAAGQFAAGVDAQGNAEGCALPAGGGTVTNVTASAPLASSGGTTPNLSLTGVVPLANIPDLGAGYIRNTAALQNPGTFNISGNGVIGGTLSVGGVTAAAARLDVAGSGWFRADGNALPAGAAQGVRVFYDTFSGAGSVFAYDYVTSNPLNLTLQYPGGNVGVGTTTPGSKLTVAGTVESTSGGVKFPDGTTQASATFKWQVVAGTTQQAQPNTGYAVTSASQVTVTLPTAPNVGDTVRVSGAGAGGWKLAQNAGQFVNAVNLGVSVSAGQIWTARESGRGWRAVASAADGSKQVAGVFGGQLYTTIASTTPGTAGYLSGGQSSAIELQYIGSSQFVPLSYVGAITNF